MSLMNRLVSLVRQRKLDRDLRDELRAHLEMRVEDNVADGMTEPEARQDAIRRFGNPTLIQEAARTQRIARWLETVWQDVHYALRIMRKKRGFTAMAILIVAVGIGAGTTLFSIAQTSLRRGVPVSDRWVMMRAFFPQRNQRVFHFSIPEYLEFRSQNQIFEKAAFIGGGPCNLVVENAPELIEAPA